MSLAKVKAGFHLIKKFWPNDAPQIRTSVVPFKTGIEAKHDCKWIKCKQSTELLVNMLTDAPLVEVARVPFQKCTSWLYIIQHEFSQKPDKARSRSATLGPSWMQGCTGHTSQAIQGRIEQFGTVCIPQSTSRPSTSQYLLLAKYWLNEVWNCS